MTVILTTLSVLAVIVFAAMIEFESLPNGFADPLRTGATIPVASRPRGHRCISWRSSAGELPHNQAKFYGLILAKRTLYAGVAGHYEAETEPAARHRIELLGGQFVQLQSFALRIDRISSHHSSPLI
jgi:hypothetical protein